VVGGVFDAPVAADDLGEPGGGDVVPVQAGDRVHRLGAARAGADIDAVPDHAGGEPGVRESDCGADRGQLQRAGLAAAVPLALLAVNDGDVFPGQVPRLGVQGGLAAFDDEYLPAAVAVQVPGVGSLVCNASAVTTTPARSICSSPVANAAISKAFQRVHAPAPGGRRWCARRWRTGAPGHRRSRPRSGRSCRPRQPPGMPAGQPGGRRRWPATRAVPRPGRRRRRPEAGPGGSWTRSAGYAAHRPGAAPSRVDRRPSQRSRPTTSLPANTAANATTSTVANS